MGGNSKRKSTRQSWDEAQMQRAIDAVNNVHRARNLLTKGKNGRNDAFVTIALAKEKYQTSVKEKSLQDVEWNEECELPIPKQGNVAEIVLTVLHRNFFGLDEFLGVVNIPLADFDVYERPKRRWYPLQSKQGKSFKERGDLEVKVSFLVKAGSYSDLKKKHRSSLGQLSHMAQSVGGSLLSIGSIKNSSGLAKLSNSWVRKSKKDDKDMVAAAANHRTSVPMSSQLYDEADPGVISEGESVDDFALDDLSHKSSASSIHGGRPSSESIENLAGGEFLRRVSASTGTSPMKSPHRTSTSTDEWDQKIFGRKVAEEDEDGIVECSDNEHRSPSPTPTPEKERGSILVRKFKQFRRESKLFDSSPSGNKPNQVEERIIVGGENTRLPPELLQKYSGKSKEDLIEIICNLESSMEHQAKRLQDLEEYLDNLLLRVMETSPRILQTPHMNSKLKGNFRLECDETSA
ncbi:hypothetical protein C0J52_03871 [Blattella germanica]|nr:hypothetical protein C0J52_03871 [Blattella germanica]